MPPLPAISEVPLVTQLCYLAASALFILSLKWLSAPTTSRRGVLVGEIGMIVAIVGTLMMPEIRTFQWIVVTLLVGTAIGIPLAMLMPMTAVPQRTALSHCFGGLAVGAVGAAEYYLKIHHGELISTFTMGVLSLGGNAGVSDVYRQSHGVRQASRTVAFASAGLQRPELHKSYSACNCYCCWYMAHNRPEQADPVSRARRHVSLYLASCLSFPSGVRICPPSFLYSTRTRECPLLLWDLSLTTNC